jgi:hypothetical protein
MNLPKRLTCTIPEAVCVAALVVLTWGTFLPFLGVPSWWGDGLQTNGTQDLVTTTWSLGGGISPQLVIVVLVILGMALAGYLLGVRRIFAALACAVASIALLLLALYEVSDGGHRLLPAWTFPPSGSPPETVTIALGFYVFRDAAAVAVIASLAMLVTQISGRIPTTRQNRQPEVT